jgi:hypothetical protein
VAMPYDSNKITFVGSRCNKAVAISGVVIGLGNKCLVILQYIL